MNAQGSLTIYTGGLMQVEGGLTAACVVADVEVLREEPLFYRVVYPERFRAQHPDLCQSDIVDKENGFYYLRYTRFTATDELPPTGTERRARYTVECAWNTPQGLAIDSKSCDVIVVEETDTHYRLRFDRQFAQEFPSLCQECVKKVTSDYQIEFLN
ncbi:MAG: hypothetical protein K2Z81_19110 [Cyanobacteria bacterium]|nr:hypothetical protein [Cyanobacteriota bacterium]